MDSQALQYFIGRRRKLSRAIRAERADASDANVVIIDGDLNPFIRACEKNFEKQVDWTDEESADALMKVLALEDKNARDGRDSKTLFLQAGNTHLSPAARQSLGDHRYDRVNHIADVFIFRYGFLTDRLIGEVMRDVPGRNTSNYQAHRQHPMRYQGQAQSHTLSFLRTRMATLVERTGGVAAWEAASHAEQRVIIKRKFLQAPLTITRYCFKYEAHVVDFEGIWGKERDGEEGATVRKWQSAITTYFVALAQKVLHIHTIPLLKSEKVSTHQQKPLFDFYKTFKQAPSLDQLSLGHIDEVPTRNSRLESGGRDRKQLKEVNPTSAAYKDGNTALELVDDYVRKRDNAAAADRVAEGAEQSSCAPLKQPEEIFAIGDNGANEVQESESEEEVEADAETQPATTIEDDVTMIERDGSNARDQQQGPAHTAPPSFGRDMRGNMQGNMQVNMQGNMRMGQEWFGGWHGDEGYGYPAHGYRGGMGGGVGGYGGYGGYGGRGGWGGHGGPGGHTTPGGFAHGGHGYYGGGGYGGGGFGGGGFGGGGFGGGVIGGPGGPHVSMGGLDQHNETKGAGYTKFAESTALPTRQARKNEAGSAKKKRKSIDDDDQDEIPAQGPAPTKAPAKAPVKAPAKAPAFRVPKNNK